MNNNYKVKTCLFGNNDKLRMTIPKDDGSVKEYIYQIWNVKLPQGTPPSLLNLQAFAQHMDNESNYQFIADKLQLVIKFPHDPSITILMQEKYTSTFVDSYALYFNKYKVQGSKFTYIGENQIATQIYGRIPISQKPSFSIKIISVSSWGLGIGVISDKEHFTRFTDIWSPDFIHYHGAYGDLVGDKKALITREGNGFKQGDVVKVNVNIEQGSIQWVVNEHLQISYKMERLQDCNINWVPYVYTYIQGDCFEWID